MLELHSNRRECTVVNGDALQLITCAFVLCYKSCESLYVSSNIRNPYPLVQRMCNEIGGQWSLVYVHKVLKEHDRMTLRSFCVTCLCYEILV